MFAKKLAALGAACTFIAAPAFAAEWSEFDPQPLALEEQADTPVISATDAGDAVHASSTASDKPADQGEKPADSQS
jgi:hypothetical protein